MLAKVFSYSLGIVDMAFNPQVQAFQALQKQEGAERAEAGPNRRSPPEDQSAFRLLIPFPAHEPYLVKKATQLTSSSGGLYYLQYSNDLRIVNHRYSLLR